MKFRWMAILLMSVRLSIRTFSIVVALASPAWAADRDAHTQKARPPFILGADISWVQQQEEEGTRFSHRGVQRDIFTILKDHGFNWIRLRIFNNSKAEKGYSRKGYCDLEHTLQMAKRIKTAGMGFLLDFHYSDTWADPGHQVKPSAWKDLHGNNLEKAVRDYTKDVVAALKMQGTAPDMVQIGNEISNEAFYGPMGRCGNRKIGTLSADSSTLESPGRGRPILP